jgi:3-oxoacyl-[acyl-carrier protein] reductase
MTQQPPIETKPLVGKTAMVTGSSSGIGRAIATELARQGADVIVHCRPGSTKIQSVCQSIAQLGVECHTVFEDFSETPNWNQFVERAWSWKGKIDCWINNAGGDVLTGDWPERKLEDKLDFLWKVDVLATLMLSKTAGARMVESGHAESDHPRNSGVILNMGWDQAWQGMAGNSGELFSTTKGAIMSMTKSLAQSLAPVVRVNSLAPGWIKTGWGDHASASWSERAKKESLMNRWGTPQDVAHVAAFLCTDAASFISGQIVPINGGFDFHPESFQTTKS